MYMHNKAKRMWHFPGFDYLILISHFDIIFVYNYVHVQDALP